MSQPTDVLLTDPTEAALADALDRTGPSTLRGPARWRPLLEEVIDNADGRSQLETTDKGEPGARYVSAAWWTDHRGVKHVRVCGGDTSFGGWHPHYSRLDDDLRPPLWHVFMGRVYRVTRRGQKARWLVSCACGMTGTPEELAWMGTRCGPCHDRLEEGQPHPDDGRPALFIEPGAGAAVAFSPDGVWLAASSGGWHLRLYELSSGESRVITGYDGDEDVSSDAHRPVTFSPDVRWLAAGVAGEWLIRFWDLTDQQGEGDLMPPGDGEEVRALAYSPDGRLFATCSDQGVLDLSTAEGGYVETDGDLPERCRVFAFSPDGRTLALGVEEGFIYLHDTQTWGRPRTYAGATQPGEEYLMLRYLPDGQQLVIITGRLQLDLGIGPHRLHLWDLQKRREARTGTLPRYVRVADVSPDGRYLAYVVHDEQHSPGEILFFDLVEWVDAGRLEWDPEDAVNDFAFSPDGQTLATISAAGVVKLWPWRLLLEG